MNFDWENVLKSLDIAEGVNVFYSLLYGSKAASGANSMFSSGVARILDNGRLSFEAFQPQKSVFRFSIVHSFIPLHDCFFFVISSILPKAFESMGLSEPAGELKKTTQPNGAINFLTLEASLGLPLCQGLAELITLNAHLCEVTYAGSMELVSSHVERRYNTGAPALFFKELQMSTNPPNSFLPGTYERLMHVQTNLFLGRSHKVLGKPPQPRRISATPATILPTVTSMGLKRWPVEKSKYFGLDEMLNTTETGPLWIGPTGVDEMEILVCLKEPCIVSDISITIRHGSNDLTSPQTMDVWYGLYLSVRICHVIHFIFLPFAALGNTWMTCTSSSSSC